MRNNKSNRQTKKYLYKVLIIICGAAFIVFTALFINDALLQPMRANRAIDRTRNLYILTSVTPAIAAANTTPGAAVTSAPTTVPEEAFDRDSEGKLLEFQSLLKDNPDTKGWLNFPDTNIDYVVMQRYDDPDYYLSHDFNGNKQKAGCLFLDSRSSVEVNTKNLVIHGHNMKSTNNMFHSLEHIKDLDYFKGHTVFRFDSIYQTGQWQIISVFITNGSDEKEPFFDYMKPTFSDSSEFLNFVYQLRIRSIYNLDQVDVNENDQLCTLSTCSYELNDYRLVIVARKVRDVEEPVINTDLITKNKNALYPESYYTHYNIEAPTYPATFEEALAQGTINWYKSPK